MFQLPQLKYEYPSLEPHIDAQTMEIHYSKHHQGYVDKLNAALAGHDDLLDLEVDELLQKFAEVPEELKTAVKNHGGGHANHSLFWQILSPQGGGKPSGDLMSALEKKFGSFDQFKTELVTTAAGQFGSGWGWLVVGPDQELSVMASANQESPLLSGKTPILGVDVWEHAYYLKYQNRRADYLEAIWHLFDWDQVASFYQKALKSLR